MSTPQSTTSAPVDLTPPAALRDATGPILIVGRPLSGKTTLAHGIIRTPRRGQSRRRGDLTCCGRDGLVPFRDVLQFTEQHAEDDLVIDDVPGEYRDGITRGHGTGRLVVVAGHWSGNWLPSADPVGTLRAAGFDHLVTLVNDPSSPGEARMIQYMIGQQLHAEAPVEGTSGRRIRGVYSNLGSSTHHWLNLPGWQRTRH